jgi:hypothetical protein
VHVICVIRGVNDIMRWIYVDSCVDMCTSGWMFVLWGGGLFGCQGDARSVCEYYCVDVNEM